MIDCDGCYLNKLYESDDERLRCLHRRTCERAYQQGRADKEKELQGISDLGRMYSEIRADERARIIDNLKSKAWVKDERAYLLYDSVLVPISLIIGEIEEELKEQNG